MPRTFTDDIVWLWRVGIMPPGDRLRGESDTMVYRYIVAPSVEECEQWAAETYGKGCQVSTRAISPVDVIV